MCFSRVWTRPAACILLKKENNGIQIAPIRCFINVCYAEIRKKLGIMIMKPLLFAQSLIKASLRPGGVAVDATCGNGHDTLFLAEQVGKGGTVYAFDIQKAALENTRRRLEEAGCLDRVKLIHAGHEYFEDYLGQPLDAVMFNLGFMPGGDCRIVTQPATTISALSYALCNLAPGGVVTVMIYTGHAGGPEEGATVCRYLSVLPQRSFSVLEYRFINQQNNPPFLLAVMRH